MIRTTATGRDSKTPRTKTGLSTFLQGRRDGRFRVSPLLISETIVVVSKTSPSPVLTPCASVHDNFVHSFRAVIFPAVRRTVSQYAVVNETSGTDETPCRIYGKSNSRRKHFDEYFPQFVIRPRVWRTYLIVAPVSVFISTTTIKKKKKQRPSSVRSFRKRSGGGSVAFIRRTNVLGPPGRANSTHLREPSRGRKRSRGGQNGPKRRQIASGELS